MSLTLLVFGFAAIVVLTGISAFFSSSELAVFSVSAHRVESLAASDTRGAAALAKLREDPHRFLVTALVSNNVANIAAASVATAVLIEFLPLIRPRRGRRRSPASSSSSSARLRQNPTRSPTPSATRSASPQPSW
ncbi:CNNM domain-containing protein [Halolamina sp.]|uniref:CNNM domain-containing protein n=1 Tax=Halolamina sp. TaxID=1940283 RepID=UPI003565504C